MKVSLLTNRIVELVHGLESAGRKFSEIDKKWASLCGFGRQFNVTIEKIIGGNYSHHEAGKCFR